MAQKKEYRKDNTRIISTSREGNPRLCAKLLSDGRESLYLDYYMGFVKDSNGKAKVSRKREYLKLYLINNPRGSVEYTQNKTTLEIANKIRYEKSLISLEGATGYKFRKDRDINFLDYFTDYYDSYTKKDKDIIKIALNRFRDFFRDTPEYNKYKDRIKPDQITKDMVEDYTDYLKSRSKGLGAWVIYAHFKKVVKYAVEHDIFIKNPCNGISIKADTQQLRKEILSIEEVKRLTATPYTGNGEVMRAFVFCLYTGIRFCDIKELPFAKVDYSNKILKFDQKKVGGHSTAAGVTIPLNEDLIRFIGTPKDGNKDELIFKLPCYSACIDNLQKWVKSAGIEKKITWHCARHSLATNLLANGADIKTVSTLLGHSSIAMTEKYLRAVDSRKRAAIDSLPKINF